MVGEDLPNPSAMSRIRYMVEDVLKIIMLRLHCSPREVPQTSVLDNVLPPHHYHPYPLSRSLFLLTKIMELIQKEDVHVQLLFGCK